MKETFHLDPSEWQETLTFNSYVPITCDDLLHLHSLQDVLKFHKLPASSLPKHIPEQYFFGNHPIARVQVAGKVVYTEYREQVGLSVFRLADGFGNSSLPCVLKHPTFVHDRPLEKGDLVAVLGRVSSFADELQVQVISLKSFPPTDVLRYYVFREEAVQTRKHVLERSADEFKSATRPGASPEILTRSTIAELTRLHKAIVQRAHDWGVSLDLLLSDPMYEWP